MEFDKVIIKESDVPVSLSGYLLVHIGEFNELPITIRDERIDSFMEAEAKGMSDAGVQRSDWLVHTYDGYLVVDGMINGSTQLNLKLFHPVEGAIAGMVDDGLNNVPFYEDVLAGRETPSIQTAGSMGDIDPALLMGAMGGMGMGGMPPMPPMPDMPPEPETPSGLLGV